jgi:hypothetical protein
MEAGIEQHMVFGVSSECATEDDRGLDLDCCRVSGGGTDCVVGLGCRPCTMQQQT